MTSISQSSSSLSDFKANTASYVDDLKRGDHALVLTVNGSPELAVMSVSTFQKVLEACNLLDSLRCVREGLEQAKRGEGMSVDECFSDLRKKWGLSGPSA